MGQCQNCSVCGMSAMGGAARSSARATMHVATGGVSLVATGLKRKCGVCRHPMARHTSAGQQVNVTNTVSPTIVVGQSVAPAPFVPAPEVPGPAAVGWAQPAALPTAVPAAPDRLQQLRELAELKQLGALTDEEFEAEKARLMTHDPTASTNGHPSALGGGGVMASLPAGEQGTGGGPQQGWYPDPLGHHELRVWDGSAWTASVADGGVEGFDPLVT